MLRLDKIIKPWKESAALNDHINLYGFWNETTFLTKSGDVGMVLSVPGVDYESLDRSEQEYAVKRLEAALKAFGPGFHVYQYLFKSNCPDIPFAKYDDPVVAAAIDQRRKFFDAKREHLYQVEIFYCILLEGSRSKTGVGAALTRLFRDPAGAMEELKTQFTNNSMKTLLRTHVERDVRRLGQQVEAFGRQLADFMQVEILNQRRQFMFFRRLMNYDDWRVAGKPQSTQFLDYQVVNSDIEAERDHLRVGDHIVRVLTMKEAITETKPLVLNALLKIPANFYVVTEWTLLSADKARKEVNKRRRHFNMSKTGFVSQMGNDATKTAPRDVLVDESKQADIENLGDCLRALGDGQSLGEFSVTIVLYGQSQAELEALRPLQSLWIDLLVLRLLNEPKDGQKRAWFVIDELASLQKLPQLHTAITENRKSNNPVILGFQGKAQLEYLYGHLAEVMLSQPATSIWLKTKEPTAGEWVSKFIGKVEIERLRETHFDGSRAGRNFALDRQIEPLVMESEISGLPDLHAYMKYENYVTRFSFPYFDMPIVASDFDLRDTPEDKLPYDPKNIGAAKPPLRPLELKPEANVPTPLRRKLPGTATEIPQRETDLETNVNAQQSLNLRG